MGYKMDKTLPEVFRVGQAVVIIPNGPSEVLYGMIVRTTKTRATVELEGAVGKYTRQFYSNGYRYGTVDYPRLPEHGGYGGDMLALPGDPGVIPAMARAKAHRNHVELKSAISEFRNYPSVKTASELRSLLMDYINMEES